MQVLLVLFLIITSSLLARIYLSVYTPWFHGTVISSHSCCLRYVCVPVFWCFNV